MLVDRHTCISDPTVPLLPAQLQAAFEEQSQKAALAWKWQQEVSRLQEKLGRRSLQVLARDKELEKVKKELKDTADLLANQQAALAASR